MGSCSQSTFLRGGKQNERDVDRDVDHDIFDKGPVACLREALSAGIPLSLSVFNSFCHPDLRAFTI